MVYAYLVVALLGFLTGHLAQKGDRAAIPVVITCALIFLLTGTPLTAVLIAIPVGGLAFLLGRRGREDVGAALAVIVTSATVFYLTISVLTAFVFAGGVIFLVRKLVKNKKKNWLAYIGSGIAIVIVLSMLSVLSLLS